MSTDKILVIMGGAIVIAFIYWFFLRKNAKKDVVIGSGAVDITVEGGYSPEVVQIPVGKVTTLNFIRTDPSSCLEEVVLADFKIRKTLPLHQSVAVEIMPKEKGEYTFSCGMNMYKGKIIVV